MLMGLVQTGKLADYCVGNQQEICSAAYSFVDSSKQSFINMRLIDEVFPKTSFLSKARASTSNSTSCSDAAKTRAAAWKARVQHGTALLQGNSNSDDNFDYSETYEMKNYKEAAPCTAGPRDAKMSYIIAEGAGDIPPVEVSGQVMDHCRAMFSEIMIGYNQEGQKVASMANDWCSWQASVGDWVESGEGAG